MLKLKYIIAFAIALTSTPMFAIADSGKVTGQFAIGGAHIPENFVNSALAITGAVGYRSELGVGGELEAGALLGQAGSIDAAAYTAMVNATYEMPTHWLKGYAGVGVGGVHTQTSLVAVDGGVLLAEEVNDNDFAWQAFAGVAVPVDSLDLGLRYRYRDLGKDFEVHSVEAVLGL